MYIEYNNFIDLILFHWKMRHLFVDPVLGSWSPADQLLFGEPEGDFFVCRLNSIRSVDDVSANLNAIIASDGPGHGISRIGGSQHLTSGFNSIQSFPDHWYNWARVHVCDESREEGTGAQISVVFLQQLLGRLHRGIY